MTATPYLCLGGLTLRAAPKTGAVYWIEPKDIHPTTGSLRIADLWWRRDRFRQLSPTEALSYAPPGSKPPETSAGTRARLDAAIWNAFNLSASNGVVVLPENMLFEMLEAARQQSARPGAAEINSGNQS